MSTIYQAHWQFGWLAGWQRELRSLPGDDTVWHKTGCSFMHGDPCDVTLYHNECGKWMPPMQRPKASRMTSNLLWFVVYISERIMSLWEPAIGLGIDAESIRDHSEHSKQWRAVERSGEWFNVDVIWNSKLFNFVFCLSNTSAVAPIEPAKWGDRVRSRALFSQVSAVEEPL